MKNIRLLALAGLFVVVAAHSRADNLTEDFSGNPADNGWQTFGDSSLFQWDPDNQNLAVTWDSTQPNSYLYKSFPTLLNIDDEFSVEFDLQLSNAVAFNYGAPLAVGLFHLSDATDITFTRGGGHSPNLFEFNFFPDTGFGDSIDATLKDQQDGYAGFYFAYENRPLDPSLIFHVKIAHAAGALTVTGEVSTNGELYTTLSHSFDGSPTNFVLDTVSISSYQDDGFGDSIFAQGTIDNINVTLPPLARGMTGQFADGVWQVRVKTFAGWRYTLQRSTDLENWDDGVDVVFGDGGTSLLQDFSPPDDHAYYRVFVDQQIQD